MHTDLFLWPAVIFSYWDVVKNLHSSINLFLVVAIQMCVHIKIYVLNY